MKPMDKDSRWQNKAGIAERYGISLRSVDNLRRRRILPHVKIGGIIRFDVEACDKAFKAFELKAV